MHGHINVRNTVFMRTSIYFKEYLTYNASHNMLLSRPHAISSRDDSFTDPRLD
jgi:hypothetical protein